MVSNPPLMLFSVVRLNAHSQWRRHRNAHSAIVSITLGKCVGKDATRQRHATGEEDEIQGNAAAR